MSQLKIKRDFTEGPLFFKMLVYTVPIMLTGILQLAYNMADNVVVGAYSGDYFALGAVNSATPVYALFINVVIGLAAGASVLIAQLWGAKAEKRETSRAIHTSLAFSFITGILLCAVELLCAKPLLRLMGTQDVFFSRSLLYVQIIAIGVPASAVYNFGAGVLRATGNSKTPLYILGVSGLANVVLNFVFVMGFGMSVAGVAIATVVSQYLSAIAVVVVLVKSNDERCRFRFSELCFDNKYLIKIVKYGLPTAVQSSMFAVSNLLLRRAINTFPNTTVTAFGVAGQVDAIVATIVSSFVQASLTFTGQNYGAGKMERVKKVFAFSTLQVFIAGVVVFASVSLFKTELASLFLDKSDPQREVILATSNEIMNILLPGFVIFGIGDVVSGCLRGMGFATLTMINSIVFTLFVRIAWVLFIFPLEPFNSLLGLFIVYPITYVLTGLAHAIATLATWKRAKANAGAKALG